MMSKLKKQWICILLTFAMIFSQAFMLSVFADDNIAIDDLHSDENITEEQIIDNTIEDNEDKQKIENVSEGLDTYIPVEPNLEENLTPIAEDNMGETETTVLESEDSTLIEGVQLSYIKPFFNLTLDGQELTNYDIMVNDTDIYLSTTKLALGNSLTPRMNNIKVKPKDDNSANWEELNIKICLYGDINRDGIIDQEDADLVQSAVLEKINLDEEQFILADIDKDGELTTEDVAEILSYANGLSDTFTAGNIKIFTYDEPWENPSEASIRKYGDVNGDGTITMADANLIEEYYLETRFPNNEQLILADLNGDNEIDMVDAGLAMSYHLGKIKTFPIGDNVLFFSNMLRYIENVNIPVKITMNTKIIQVEANRNSAVALDENGNVYSWGDGSYYDLGHGEDNNNVHYPKKVENLPEIIKVAKGKHHTLALDRYGYIWGWGHNSSGELGSDLKGKVYVPTKISGIEKVIDISAGSGFSVAIVGDGSIWSWGGGSAQLGIKSVPSGVPGVILGGAAEYSGLERTKYYEYIDCGESYTLCIRNNHPFVDQDITAWGVNNYGQLGIGTEDSSHYISRVLIDSSNWPHKASAGKEHALAISDDKTVYAWGKNSVGQLGLGDKNNRNIPVEIPDFDDIKFVEASFAHSIAIKEDGTLYTWGEGRDGQMGNGTYQTSRVPVKVDGMKNAKSATGGSKFTIVLDEKGEMWSFGDNEFGQLGVGIYNNAVLIELGTDKFLPPASESEPLWKSTIAWWQYHPEDETDLYPVCHFELLESRVICKGKLYTVPKDDFIYHVIYADYDYERNSNYELCAKVYYNSRAEYYLDPGERIENGYGEDEIAYFDDYALVPIAKLYSDGNGQLFEV